MMLPIQNHKKNNILNVRVSDVFLDSLNRVIKIMKEEFNEEITASEALRRLASYSFTLVFEDYKVSDFLRTLSHFYIYRCEGCGWSKITNETIKFCPECGSNKIERERIFTPDAKLMELTRNISLTKVIEAIEKIS